MYMVSIKKYFCQIIFLYKKTPRSWGAILPEIRLNVWSELTPPRW